MHKSMLFLLLLFAGVSNGSEQRLSTSPCQGLVSSYAIDQFEQLLVVTDKEFSSVEDCEQLGQFFFEQRRYRYHSLDYSGLAAIVDDTWQPANEDAPFLLMDAILSWMRELGFERHAESFKNFINEYLPAEDSVRLFFTLVIWMILLAVVLLVGYELYRAGLLKLPYRRQTQKDKQAQQNKAALSWEAITGLPLRRQIGALLQFSIERLVTKNLVPSSRSLTNHELVAYLEKSGDRTASLLREQIERTEPSVYGDVPVSEQLLVRCRAIARRISDA
jgi:hypothetical protein